MEYSYNSTNPDRNILVPGKPPLTLEIAELLQETIEKALSSNLTTAQQELFRQELISEWRQNRAAQAALRDTITQFRAIWQQIAALPPAKQTLSWQEFGRRLYIYARQHDSQDPLGQLIVKLYEAKQHLLVKSTPPLSLQAAVSYAEMSLFVHNLIVDAETTIAVKLDTIQQHAVVSYLQTEFPQLSPDMKEQISQADGLWGLLRYNWEQASKTEREAFREELLALELTGVPALPIVEDNIPSPKSNLSPAYAVATAPGETLPVVTTISAPMSEVLVKNHRFMGTIQKLREQAGKGNLGLKSLLRSKR
jgi:hypothetical protein